MGLSAQIERASQALDERFNLKHAHRQMQGLAKVLIVTTFMEDAIRVLITFSTQQQSMRIAGWQWPLLHTALPCFSFAVQSSGSLLILLPSSRGRRNQYGCFTLLGWCLFHPFMYRQQTNWEFVLETTTIMGGLLILLSHFMLVSASVQKIATLPAKAVGPAVSARSDPVTSRAHATQAVGRVLIVAVFLYYAFEQVHGYVQRSLSELSHSNWVTPLIEGALIVALLYMCSLVIIGIKSRWVALFLAVLMFLSACWLHPFWIYIFSTKTYRMEGVAYMEGFEVDAFTMADHTRYFFFQSMSTVGALLLLVVHGPGKLSMDDQQGQLVLITTHNA